jgi:hypothetical protein
MSIQLEMECLSLYGGWLEVHRPIFSWNLPLPLPNVTLVEDYFNLSVPDEFSDNQSAMETYRQYLQYLSDAEWLKIFKGHFQIQGNAVMGSVVGVEDAVLLHEGQGVFKLQGNLGARGLSSFRGEVLAEYKNYTVSKRDDFFTYGFIDDCNYEDLVVQDVSVLIWLHLHRPGLDGNPAQYKIIQGTWNGMDLHGELSGTYLFTNSTPFYGASGVFAWRLFERASANAYESNFTSC